MAQYQSGWQAQLQETAKKILNREPFQYDVNGDALYRQYRDKFTTQGRMAMMDTMGQAQAMTGGYGNSYAQNAGQQAYQGYLQGLGDKIPELYQLAMSKYQMEGDDLARQYSMLGAMDDRDYGRHRDAVEDQYRADRDKAADAQWQAEFDEAVRQFNFANKLGEFAPTASAKKSGNPNPDPGTPKRTFDEVRQDYIDGSRDYATEADRRNGIVSDPLTKEEKKALLEAAVADGSITQGQAYMIEAIYGDPTSKKYTAADRIWDRNS